MYAGGELASESQRERPIHLRHFPPIAKEAGRFLRTVT